MTSFSPTAPTFEAAYRRPLFFWRELAMKGFAPCVPFSRGREQIAESGSAANPPIAPQRT